MFKPCCTLANKTQPEKINKAFPSAQANLVANKFNVTGSNQNGAECDTVCRHHESKIHIHTQLSLSIPLVIQKILRFRFGAS
jgi:hypothetical protein